MNSIIECKLGSRRQVMKTCPRLKRICFGCGIKQILFFIWNFNVDTVSVASSCQYFFFPHEIFNKSIIYCRVEGASSIEVITRVWLTKFPPQNLNPMMP